jgi:aerobic-type carbon monoxide dehydrogenase small subunit (CoxS/CutS family)
MRLTVNGRVHDLDPAGAFTLLELLRGRLALTGTKIACGHGECGACTVQLDGEVVYSCLTLAAACEGANVVTVEGLAGGLAGGLASGVGEPSLSPLQRAFIEKDAAQCGFCTPGQLVAAHTLLARNPNPTDEEIRAGMSGNLCRCGTYPKIFAAIRAVANGEFAESAKAGSAEAGGAGAA